jgi:RNA polymerase sigma-70 factor (ECF subfamily)
MVVNCCLLQIREARRRGSWVQLEGQGGQHHTDRLPSSLPTPEKYTWGREIAAALSYALARLPKHLRETYTLFTEAEMSLHEVASTMGLSLSATKTRIFRARAGLRTSLQPVWAGRRARTPASS